jgi:uncharacterized protein
MRKIGWFERKKIFSYISSEPEMTIFINGDMRAQRLFKKTPFEVYVSETKSGDYDFLIHKYFDSYGIYTPKDTYDIQAAVDFLKSRKVDTIAGKENLILPLEKYFPNYTMKMTYLCRVTEESICFVDNKIIEGITLHTLGPEDAEEVAGILLAIPSIAQFYKGEYPLEKAKAKIIQNMNSGNFYGGAFKDGKLIGFIGTSATTKEATEITELTVLPDYRNRGIATKLICSCCHKLLNDGLKLICLFYDDYEAGKIYTKLGFEFVGKYALLH